MGGARRAAAHRELPKRHASEGKVWLAFKLSYVRRTHRQTLSCSSYDVMCACIPHANTVGLGGGGKALARSTLGDTTLNGLRHRKKSTTTFILFYGSPSAYLRFHLLEVPPPLRQNALQRLEVPPLSHQRQRGLASRDGTAAAVATATRCSEASSHLKKKVVVQMHVVYCVAGDVIVSACRGSLCFDLKPQHKAGPWTCKILRHLTHR